MKKSISLLLAILMTAGIFAAMPLTASADSVYGDFTYTIENDEAAITGYNGSGGDIEIPYEIEDCPVTAIGENAFYDNDDITGVTIPNSIYEIGKNAFGDCSGLTSVEIPDNVVVIGDSAFENCDLLESVTIPQTVVTIGESAFSGCRLLKKVEIENGLMYINKYAFYDCFLLMSLTLPESVTEIQDYAIGYYFDSESHKMVVNDGFVMYCYDGSIAETYAKNNNLMITSITPLEVYVTTSSFKYTYTGKAIKPAVTVSDSKGYVLKKNVDYTIKYPKNPVNAGSYSIEVKLINAKYEDTGIAYALYTITQAKNTIAVKGLSKTVKYTDVKKKNVTVTALSIKKAKGKLTCKKLSGSSKITVNKKTGKFTVNKGTKKGTYKVKVKVSDDGGRNYTKSSKTVTAKITVK